MIAGVPFTGNLELVKGNWTEWSTIQALFFLGDLNTMPLSSLIKHILGGVCSPRGRIAQVRVWYISLLHLFSHCYLFFSKATTGLLLRPTFLPAAMYHSSLRELPAPNRLRLILPYLILAGALFEGNPVKVCHNRMSDFKSAERVARV